MNQQFLIWFSVVSLQLVAGNVALGQVVAKGLRSVDYVNLVVAPLEDGAKACGVVADALDAAMRVPILTSALELKPPDPDEDLWVPVVDAALSPFLYADVLAIQNGDSTCAVSVRLAMYKIVYFGRERADAAFAIIWSSSELLTGSQARMGSRVANSLEGLTKEFLGAWSRAN
jgi:hypothetical protein